MAGHIASSLVKAQSARRARRDADGRQGDDGTGRAQPVLRPETGRWPRAVTARSGWRARRVRPGRGDPVGHRGDAHPRAPESVVTRAHPRGRRPGLSPPDRQRERADAEAQRTLIRITDALAREADARRGPTNQAGTPWCRNRTAYAARCACRFRFARARRSSSSSTSALRSGACQFSSSISLS
jgi:hypothetical protein